MSDVFQEHNFKTTRSHDNTVGRRKTQDRGISPGKGRFGSIARGPLGQDRGKMLAIEAPKGPRKTQDRRISPGKGRFGSIARGPLGQDRGKMLAIEAPKGPKKDPR